MININTRLVNGISFKEYYSSTHTKKPLIIIEHGIGGNKDSFACLAHTLASKGYFVICPDAYGHGDTVSEELTVPAITVKTAENFERILEEYGRSPEADVYNYGIIGFSLGGCAAYYCASHSKYSPSVIATICATPDWSELTGKSIMYNTFLNNSWKAVTDATAKKAIDDYLISNSPLNNLNALKDTHFLIIKGGKDTTVPVNASEKFNTSINDPNRCVLSVYENLGHMVNNDELDEVIQYIEKYFTA